MHERKSTSAFAILLFSVVTSASEPSNNLRFTYTPDGSSGLFINLKDNVFNSFGSDHIETATACPEQDDYICLKTPTFTFSIPKKIPPDRKWFFDGFYSEAGKTEERQVLGEKFHGFSIVQSRAENWRNTSDFTIEYFFSNERGLMSISWIGESPYGVTTFLLKESCGFGASECY